MADLDLQAVSVLRTFHSGQYAEHYLRDAALEVADALATRVVLTEDELKLLMSDWTDEFDTFMDAVQAALAYVRTCNASGTLPGNAAEAVLSGDFDPDTSQPCVGCDSTISRTSAGDWAHDEPGHSDHDPVLR